MNYQEITKKMSKVSMEDFVDFFHSLPAPTQINSERLDSGYRYYELTSNRTLAYWKCEGRREYWIEKEGSI